MTDAQVLALLAGMHETTPLDMPGHAKGWATDILVWAKTEGMADVDTRVRAWHEARLVPDTEGLAPRRRDFVPACPDCDGSGTLRCRDISDGVDACLTCHGTGDRPPTYEENHIRFPSGEPRP